MARFDFSACSAPSTCEADWEALGKEPEELKIAYEMYGIKVTVEIPLGDSKEVMDRLAKVASTVDSLRKAYEELKL